jgi:hypothetical protein
VLLGVKYGRLAMAKFKITLKKDYISTYEITDDVNDVLSVQMLEEEKLVSSEYEESLGLDWNVFDWTPELIDIEQLTSDNVP